MGILLGFGFTCFAIGFVLGAAMAIRYYEKDRVDG